MYTWMHAVRCVTSAGQSEECQRAVMSSAASTFHFGCATLSLTSLLQQLFVIWLHQEPCGREPQSWQLIYAVFSSEHTARQERRKERRGEGRGGEGRRGEERRGEKDTMHF